MVSIVKIMKLEEGREAKIPNRDSALMEELVLVVRQEKIMKKLTKHDPQRHTFMCRYRKMYYRMGG